MTWLLAVMLIFALAVAAFAAQNGQTVEVKFLFWTMHTTAAVVILGAAAGGAVITAILGLVAQIRTRLRMRKMDSENRTLRQAVSRVGQPEAAAGQAGASAAPGSTTGHAAPAPTTAGAAPHTATGNAAPAPTAVEAAPTGAEAVATKSDGDAWSPYESSSSESASGEERSANVAGTDTI